MDIYSKGKRSWNMSRVRSQDTKPEMIVRSFLHRNGFRFRLHVKNLPGHPDIVLPKYKTVIEVRGCYWHRHKNCSRATIPSTNVAFWQKKFAENTARDHRTDAKLKSLGWNVIIVWECELNNKNNLDEIVMQIRANSLRWMRRRETKMLDGKEELLATVGQHPSIIPVNPIPERMQTTDGDKTT